MKVLLTIAASLCATTALADRINGGGYVGCITEAALDEFISAAVNNDERHMNALLGVTCVGISGLEYSMVNAGFMTSEVRVYAGDNSMVLYTVAEAAQ